LKLGKTASKPASLLERGQRDLLKRLTPLHHSDEMKKKVLGKKEPTTCCPADLLQPGLEAARKEIGSLAGSEEDVISYALFPEIAKGYFFSGEGRQDWQ